MEEGVLKVRVSTLGKDFLWGGTSSTPIKSAQVLLYVPVAQAIDKGVSMGVPVMYTTEATIPVSAE